MPLTFIRNLPSFEIQQGRRMSWKFSWSSSVIQSEYLITISWRRGKEVMTYSPFFAIHGLYSSPTHPMLQIFSWYSVVEYRQIQNSRSVPWSAKKGLKRSCIANWSIPCRGHNTGIGLVSFRGKIATCACLQQDRQTDMTGNLVSYENV